MVAQNLYWIVFVIMLFVVMFITIPPKRGPILSPFGFWMGLIPAFGILWLGQVYFKFFRLIGAPALIGISILAAVAWIPPAILFAFYYPIKGLLWQKIGMVIVFASATTVVQYLLDLLGMWQNIRWSPFYTFLLAIVTHTIMGFYVQIKRKKYRPETVET
jgi:hypothetical protein